MLVIIPICGLISFESLFISPALLMPTSNTPYLCLKLNYKLKRNSKVIVI